MPIFTDEEMQEFADTFEELGMPDHCVIEREFTSDARYGQEVDLITSEESACLVSDPKSKSTSELLQAYADRLGSLASWPISLPLGRDVQEGDFLTVTSRLIPQSQKMKVQVLLSPKSFAVSTNVIASEIKS